MRAALFALALPAFAQLNSVRCQATSTCALTVSQGSTFTVATWGPTSPGTISDSQSNIYTALHIGDTYNSHARLLVTKTTAAGLLTVTSSQVEPNIVLAELPPNVTPELYLSAAYNQGGQSYGTCPPGPPLSIAPSVDTYILSIWAMDGGNASSCSVISGKGVATGTCGGLTGWLASETAPAGTHMQQFTLNPTYNGGNTNCGMYALKLAAPVPPVVVPPPPTGSTGNVTVQTGMVDPMAVLCTPPGTANPNYSMYVNVTAMTVWACVSKDAWAMLVNTY